MSSDEELASVCIFEGRTSKKFKLCQISYYVRKNYTQHIIRLCDTALKRRIGDPVLLFWRATAFSSESTLSIFKVALF